MKQEEVIKLGVTEDIAKQIIAMSEKELTEEKTKLTDKEAELTMATNTIKELTDKVKTFDGVDVEKLKSDASEWEKKYNSDIQDVKIDGAVSLALAGAKAKDVELAKSLVDKKLLKLDNGKLVGLDEQLAKIKTDKAFLFEPEAGTGDDMYSSGTDHKNPAGADTSFNFGFTGVRTPETK